VGEGNTSPFLFGFCLVFVGCYVMAIDRQYYTSELIDGELRYSANVGNPVGDAGVRSHICAVCQLAFKENKMVQYQGQWYGIPCGCSKDIVSLRRKNRVSNHIGGGRDGSTS
jgi:hypothetical protein